MLKLLLISPAKYLRLGITRILQPISWRLWRNRRFARLSHDGFVRICGFSGPPSEFLPSFHDEARLRFFFHPRNQKDFFLNLLTRTQSEEGILTEAQDVLDNKFETLGSGKVELGETINWHRDFKSGKVWDVKTPMLLHLMDVKNPSDVKVPWELSRFHQVWWLGKAYWLTRNEVYAKKFMSLIDDWIEQNPVGLGVNWALAMEVAFRAMNWIAGYCFFCESKSIPDAFWLRLLKSLYVHGEFIRNHLEYTWRNENHIVSDVVGLTVLGIFFRNTPFGKKWISWGVRNLEIEMREQVHEDGVDYEKSTSYHRLVAELFYTSAILCQRNQITLSPGFSRRLEQMLEFVELYTRPDGSIPLFGDADDGRLFRFSASDDINDHRHALSVGAILFKRADFKRAAGKFHQDALWLFGGEGFERYQMIKDAENDVNSREFSGGGFYIMRGENAHVMIDAGDIGLDGMGGHGHNDTLSFEYWLKGEPLIVDSGSYAYTFDVAARQEMRSTRSHNTIVVDGKEIARFVGLWLIRSDKTKTRVLEWKTSPTEDVLEAAHSAYGSALSPLIHKRRVILDKRRFRLEIIDRLEGKGDHALESYLHFAPKVSVEIIGPGQAVVDTSGRSYNVTCDAGQFKVINTWFSRSYGIREKNKSLVLQIKATLPLRIALTISPA